MDIPSIDYYNASTITHRGMSKHYPDFVAMLDNDKAYKDLPWTEKLYRYYNHLSDAPRCPICGKPVKFINFFAGYRQFCSNKCLGKSEDIQRKREETTRSHYGVKYPMQSKDIMQKSIDTCIDKYGVSNAGGASSTLDKIKKTNLDRRGVEYPMQSPEVADKYKQTCMERYGKVGYNNRGKNEQTCKIRYDGVGYASSDLSHKAQQTCMDRYGASNYSSALGSSNNPDFIGYDSNGDWICQCPHPETCNQCQEGYYIISRDNHNGRKKNHVEPCTRLLPIQSPFSSYELQVRSWLDRLKIEYISNDREIISPQELDIYIPSYELAIEINGCYWHSIEYKSKNYHYDKWFQCKEKGIKMITLWEDWIHNYPNECKQLIMYHLGMMTDILDIPWDHNLVDLGLGSGSIKEHLSIHDGYECWDCGLFI